MSYVRFFQLRCDGCRRSAPVGEGRDIATLRRLAKHIGWTRVPRNADHPLNRDGRGLDLCSTCSI